MARKRRSRKKKQSQTEGETEAENKPKPLTPYQGPFRTFGYFKCEKCKHSWASACSWANAGQQCFQCKGHIYPHAQRPLQRSKKSTSESVKPHAGAYCDMCKKLGHTCAKLRAVNKKLETKENNIEKCK